MKDGMVGGDKAEVLRDGLTKGEGRGMLRKSEAGLGLVRIFTKVAKHRERLRIGEKLVVVVRGARPQANPGQGIHVHVFNSFFVLLQQCLIFFLS